MGEADQVAIIKRAEAEEQSMKILGEAIEMQGGQDIVKLQLAQKYLENMRTVLTQGKCTVAPQEATSISTLMALFKEAKV